MNHFRAGRLTFRAVKFAVYQKTFAAKPVILPLNHPTLINFVDQLKRATTDFRASGMRDGAKHLIAIQQHLAATPTHVAASLSSEARHARREVVDQLMQRKFLRVSDDRSKYLDQKDLFGPKVTKRFKDAAWDICESGNCLAAECNTAAVFHLMRTFEWGLREFCAELGIRRFLDWSKKEKRFKRTPASYATWEKFIGQLPDRIEKRLARLGKGPMKQKRQQYYYSVYDDIKSVKDAWRNHVMHTRQTFTREEAEAVYVRVKNIMIRMADRP